ncbi:unnamed protein product [Cyclocybe aegerita]|uniref:Cytochrome P450 n=1 Tax=Cyclocybe aegerita TaxID=1973307 RepID=A0A8S0VTD2_CYCAE|nr:unnamed protein product [Cyclocybe aegerita]
MNAFVSSYGVHDLPILLLKICGVAVLTVILRGLIWFINMICIRPLSDPLRHIPGPDGAIFQTHLRQVMDPGLSADTHRDWRARFGETFRFHGFGRHDYRLMTFDFRSIVHILSSPAYEKPWQTRSFLGKLIGRGIFSMEGPEHRMQRRIIAPAFTYQSIRNMTPVLFQKAEELSERWKDVVIVAIKQEEGCRASTPSAGAVVDLAHWISRASFDVIGLAGFNYDFHSIQDDSEEVYTAYRRMFDIADKGLGLREILELYFPITRKIFVTEDIAVTNVSLRVIAEAGKKIVAENKAAYLDAQENGNESKDLLTLLIKSNLSEDSSKRLTDQELLDQCSTFLLAGSDTVSMALSWCIHFLSLYPVVQTRLRREIRSIYNADDGYLSDASADSGFHECTTCNPRPHRPNDWATLCACPPKGRLETIEGLYYLDAVVRETLRFCPPVHATIRVAVQDDYIPVSHPVTLANGKTAAEGEQQSYVKIRKGSYVHIPIEGFNYSESVWGEDALQFNPDRWKDVQEWDPSKPGLNNLMTFGYGPHSCLGHRFSIAEMKIFLVVLIASYEFSPAEDVKISKFNSILTRPYVSGEWSVGTRLPIFVRRAN